MLLRSELHPGLLLFRDRVQFPRKIARDTPEFWGIAGDFYAEVHTIGLLCVAPCVRNDYRRMGRRQGVLLDFHFILLVAFCLSGCAA